jgi:hypothetical protein
MEPNRPYLSQILGGKLSGEWAWRESSRNVKLNEKFWSQIFQETLLAVIDLHEGTKLKNEFKEIEWNEVGWIQLAQNTVKLWAKMASYSEGGNEISGPKKRAYFPCQLRKH